MARRTAPSVCELFVPPRLGANRSEEKGIFLSSRHTAEIGPKELGTVAQKGAGIHRDEGLEIPDEVCLVVESMVQRQAAQWPGIVLQYGFDHRIHLTDLGEVLRRNANHLFEVAAQLPVGNRIRRAKFADSHNAVVANDIADHGRNHGRLPRFGNALPKYGFNIRNHAFRGGRLPVQLSVQCEYDLRMRVGEVSDRVSQRARAVVHQSVVTGGRELEANQLEAPIAPKHRPFTAQLSTKEEAWLAFVYVGVEVNGQRAARNIAEEDTAGGRDTQLAWLLADPVNCAMYERCEVRGDRVLGDVGDVATHPLKLAGFGTKSIFNSGQGCCLADCAM